MAIGYTKISKEKFPYTKYVMMTTDRSEFLKEINGVFIDILDNDSIILNEDTVADDIEEWDSLTHVQLVVAIEKHFRIRFTSREIQSWNNVGEMISSIIGKQTAS